MMYAYNAADVTDNDNYVIALESSVNASSLQVAQVNTKKVAGLDYFVLAKKCGISPKKARNKVCHTTQHHICTVLHLSSSRQFRTNDHQLQYRGIKYNMYSDTNFATTVSRKFWLDMPKSEVQEALSSQFQ